MKRIPAVCLVACAMAANVAAESAQRKPAHRPLARHAKPATPRKLPCGDPLAFEILLDRQNFSPGEIAQTLGPNATRAIAALQAARGLEPTGDADCDTWHALGGDRAGAV